MNTLRKMMTAIMAAAMISSSCVVPVMSTSYNVEAATISISTTTSTITVGQYQNLSISGTKSKAKWTSSNTKVAKVTSSGKVTGVKAGKATITAKIGSKSYTCKVTVVNADAHASSITVTSADGGDLIPGFSTAKISFVLDTTSTGVKVYIRDISDDTIKTLNVAKVKAGITNSLEWDIASSVAPGGYIVTVVAGTVETTSNAFSIISNDFADGNGSKENPYVVSNLTEFKSVANHNGCYFKQSADIDFDYGNIKPLFAKNYSFVGVYDGAGYALNNYMNTEGGDNNSIFGYIGLDGTVENVTINNASLSGNRECGIISSNNSGMIKGCTINNSTMACSSVDTGMICGENDGKIMNCTVSGTIASSYAGGIAGENNGVISNCNSSVSISGYDIGGIVGKNIGTVIACTASGSIEPKGSNNGMPACGGGVCGSNEKVIQQCSYTGISDVSLVGFNKGTIQ